MSSIVPTDLGTKFSLWDDLARRCVHCDKHPEEHGNGSKCLCYIAEGDAGVQARLRRIYALLQPPEPRHG